MRQYLGGDVGVPLKELRALVLRRLTDMDGLPLAQIVDVRHLVFLTDHYGSISEDSLNGSIAQEEHAADVGLLEVRDEHIMCLGFLDLEALAFELVYEELSEVLVDLNLLMSAFVFELLLLHADCGDLAFIIIIYLVLFRQRSTLKIDF